MKKHQLVLGGIVLGLVVFSVLLCVAFYRMSHGDINLDGKVDSLDLSLVLSNWTK